MKTRVKAKIKSNIRNKTISRNKSNSRTKSESTQKKKIEAKTKKNDTEIDQESDEEELEEVQERKGKLVKNNKTLKSKNNKQTAINKNTSSIKNDSKKKSKVVSKPKSVLKKSPKNNRQKNSVSTKNNITNSRNSEESDEEDHNQANKNQLTTVVSKGGAIVDSHCPGHHLCHVISDNLNRFNGKSYSATLMYSDLKHNNNKFYIIQVIREDNSGQVYFFTRWGRVGSNGQQGKDSMSLESAINAFLKKYSDKTSNGYTEVEMDYSNEEEKPKESSKKKMNKKMNKKNKSDKLKKSSLIKEIQELMTLIFNRTIMNQQMTEIGYDAQKLPLGKLSKEMLKKGYEILQQIEKCIEGKLKADLYELSSQFYTVIPHNFGYK
jgi:poly [ADP-ribose] polymerase